MLEAHCKLGYKLQCVNVANSFFFTEPIRVSSQREIKKRIQKRNQKDQGRNLEVSFAYDAMQGYQWSIVPASFSTPAIPRLVVLLNKGVFTFGSSWCKTCCQALSKPWLPQQPTKFNYAELIPEFRLGGGLEREGKRIGSS